MLSRFGNAVSQTVSSYFAADPTKIAPEASSISPAVSKISTESELKSDLPEGDRLLSRDRSDSGSSIESFIESEIDHYIQSVIDTYEEDFQLLYLPRGTPKGPFKPGKRKIYVITKEPLSLFYIHETTGAKTDIGVDEFFLKQLEEKSHLGENFETQHEELANEDVIVLDAHVDGTFKDEDGNENILINESQFNNVLSLVKTYQLKSCHVDPTLGNLYHAMQISTGKISVGLHDQLKAILDPVTYTLEFTQSKDSEGHYILNSTDTVVNNYKKVFNILKNVEKFFEELVPIHIFIMSNKTYRSLAMNAMSTLDQTWKLMQAYQDVYNSVEDLQLYPFISKLSSFQALKTEIIAKSPFSLAQMKQEANENPFYHSFNTNWAQWQAMLAASTTTLSSIKIILAQANRDVRQEAIENTLNTISDILMRIEYFSATSQNPRDLFYFVYKIYPKITNLMNTFPQSFVALKNVLNEHILVSKEQLNLTMQDIYLQLDAAEMQFHLKENLLSSTSLYDISIDSVAKGFNDWIESLGYEFKEENRYPYLHAKKAQRLQLERGEVNNISSLITPISPPEQKIEVIADTKPLTTLPQYASLPSTSSAVVSNINQMTDKKVSGLALTTGLSLAPSAPNPAKINSHIASRRVTSIKTSIQNATLAHANEVNAVHNRLKAVRLFKINNLIDKRITTLQAEANSWFRFAKTKNKKIRALTLLKTKLVTTSLNDALNAIRVDPITASYIKHLSNGRTGAVLKEMKLIVSTPEDRTQRIELEIERLKNDRSRKLYFFATSRRVKLEKHIRALLHLKTLLNKPGYLLENAKSEMSINFPEDYHLLIVRDKKLLSDITTMDSALCDKTSEITFSTDERVRKLYPKHLKDVSKITEVDNLDGTLYREVQFTNMTPTLREFNIKDRPSLFALNKVKNGKPDVYYVPGAMLGKRLINHKPLPVAAPPANYNFALRTDVQAKIKELDKIILLNGFFNGTLKKQRYLLGELNQQLATKSFQDALNGISYNPTFISDYPLLWQNGLGTWMKALEANAALQASQLSQFSSINSSRP